MSSDRDARYGRAAPGRHRRRPRRRTPLVALTITIIVAFVPLTASVGSALSAPGQADTSVRLVEWVRDHGGGGLVNAVENVWFGRNRPADGPPDPSSLPTRGALGAVPVSIGGPAKLPLPRDGALPGEGQWQAGPRRVGARIPLYTAFFRPLPAASVVVGAAWIDQTLTRTDLVAGTQDPLRTVAGKTVDGHGGRVPDALRDSLLATLNGGFKLQDARGGYQVGDRVVIPLRPGGASLVIDSSGRVDIGAWGGEVGPATHPVAVRQNLDLIVDSGAPVAGLAENPGQIWGAHGMQQQYTWRSALGVDARGDLVYVAADHIQLTDLGRALVAAGAVRGMQLDIHPQSVSFRRYGPGPATPTSSVPLLPLMRAPADRYLVPSQRDFLAVGVR